MGRVQFSAVAEYFRGIFPGWSHSANPSRVRLAENGSIFSKWHHTTCGQCGGRLTLNHWQTLAEKHKHFARQLHLNGEKVNNNNKIITFSRSSHVEISPGIFLMKLLSHFSSTTLSRSSSFLITCSGITWSKIIILYYIILYYIILYYIILYYIILYYIILYYIILYYIILYYITLYYIILHCILLYYVIWYYITLYYIILHLFYYIILYYYWCITIHLY